MYAILSDIHGNMFALQSVLNDMKKFNIQGVILLGDLIDYGMQSNEVIDFFQNQSAYDIICNIWGNHEMAIMTSQYDKFSSLRGVQCAKYTETILSPKTKQYIKEKMCHKGWYSFDLEGKKILAVHGSKEDYYWKAIEPDNVKGDYQDYDLVLSGHSHYSFIFTKFYETYNLAKRNKHVVCFINPGSVGQPRNHNANAQYALLDADNMTVVLRAVEYDIEAAMNLYNNHVDEFYRKRLKEGI